MKEVIKLSFGSSNDNFDEIIEMNGLICQVTTLHTVLLTINTLKIFQEELVF